MLEIMAELRGGNGISGGTGPRPCIFSEKQFHRISSFDGKDASYSEWAFQMKVAIQSGVPFTHNTKTMRDVYIIHVNITFASLKD